MPTTETAKVIRIIDGDTLVIQDYRRIRLLGCNAPEIKHKYGTIATQFAIERLLDKDITLEYEINKIDYYGRTLAYIWVDGYLFNLQLIRHGLAVPLIIAPNGETYKTEIFAASKYAQDNKLGMFATGANYPNNLIDELSGRTSYKFTEIDRLSYLHHYAYSQYAFEHGIKVPMYIDLDNHTTSLTIARWWRLTKNASLEIHETMDLMYELINAYNKTDEIKATPELKIHFTPNYPKWLFDDSKKAEPNISNRIVTFRVSKREPGSMSSKPFRGKKEYSPHLREEATVQNEFGDLEAIEVWGQWFDNIIRFECWAPTEREAENLAFTFEGLLRKYRDYILRRGVQKMLYMGRTEDFHLNISKWHCRSLNVYFRTEWIDVRRSVAISAINVEAMSYRNLIKIQNEIQLNANGG